MINILFDNRQDNLDILDILKDKIEIAVEACLAEENIEEDVEISVSFVTNEEIKNLNGEYRNIDDETDVLSFPFDYDFNIGDGYRMLGDIVISVEKAKDQSIEYGHSIEREIIYLVIHSMFHLLGYDHINQEDKVEMRKKEKTIIRKIGLFKDER